MKFSDISLNKITLEVEQIWLKSVLVFCLVSKGILDQAFEHMHSLKVTFINLFIAAFPEVFWSNAEF